MPQISVLPERLIRGPRGVMYEVHRATIAIPDAHGISIGFAAYRDGTVVPRLQGQLIIHIGSSRFVYVDQILGPAVTVVTKNLPTLTVIMVCVDDLGKIRGTSTVEHRNYPSRWCLF